MKTLTLEAKQFVDKEARLIIEGIMGDKAFNHQIEEELAHRVTNDVLKTIKNEKNKGVIESEISTDSREYDIYKMRLTLVNTEELIEFKMKKDELEKENIELKEKIKHYEALGLKDVVDAMDKVEAIIEYIEKLQELANEFTKRIGV